LPPTIKQNAPVVAMKGFTGQVTKAGKPIVQVAGRNYQIPQRGVSSSLRSRLASSTALSSRWNTTQRGIAKNNLALLSKGAVIGKVKDLQPGRVRQGEASLLDRLPDKGSPRANWQQNSSVLRGEMRKGQPIRDSSVDKDGNLRDDRGFLKGERNLLREHGWTYDRNTATWNPPGAHR
jgi:hypothetical protein